MNVLARVDILAQTGNWRDNGQEEITRHAHLLHRPPRAQGKGDFYNPRLRHQDELISQEGREQARRLWSYLCDKQVSAIYVSGYQRTGESIANVAEQLGTVPTIDERLNEIDNGCFDGMNEQEIQERYPEIWQAFHERSADFRFPEGETGAKARRRIAGFL